MRSKIQPSGPTIKVRLARLAAAFLIGLASLSSSIQAATDTTNLNVSASIAPACTVGVTALNFGVYSGDGTDMTATATLTTSCSGGPTTPWTATFDGGSSGIRDARRLVSPDGTITWDYNIYADGGYIVVLGDPLISGSTVAMTSVDGPSQTIYGLLPVAGIPTAADTYIDIVVVTLTF